MKKQTKKVQESKKVEESTELRGDEMVRLLLELKNSVYWNAIVQYTNVRASLTDDALRSSDPFKDPTQIAQNQGLRLGLYDMIWYIINKEREIKEKST